MTLPPCVRLLCSSLSLASSIALPFLLNLVESSGYQVDAEWFFPSFLRCPPSWPAAHWTLPERQIKSPWLSHVGDRRCISFERFLTRKEITWLCGWFWRNKKLVYLLHAPLWFNTETHSWSLCAYSENFCLLTFLFHGCGCRVWWGDFFSPLLRLVTWGEKMLLRHVLCYNLASVAAALWICRGTRQFFDPFTSFFQWHFMQKASYYLVAATRQLYSRSDSQNYNILPKLFRKSYIPSSGDRSNVIPEGCWCYVLSLITWELKRGFLMIFFTF